MYIMTNGNGRNVCQHIKLSTYETERSNIKTFWTHFEIINEAELNKMQFRFSYSQIIHLQIFAGQSEQGTHH